MQLVLWEDYCRNDILWCIPHHLLTRDLLLIACFLEDYQKVHFMQTSCFSQYSRLRSYSLPTSCRHILCHQWSLKTLCSPTWYAHTQDMMHQYWCLQHCPGCCWSNLSHRSLLDQAQSILSLSQLYRSPGWMLYRQGSTPPLRLFSPLSEITTLSQLGWLSPPSPQLCNCLQWVRTTFLWGCDRSCCLFHSRVLLSTLLYFSRSKSFICSHYISESVFFQCHISMHSAVSQYLSRVFLLSPKMRGF